jgi:group II intron reverse transcriptase/maturase
MEQRPVGEFALCKDTEVKTTEIQSKTDTKLQRIAWLSKENPQKIFTCLMHHINEESLKECFSLLDGNRAVGTDGVKKADYKLELDANLKNLIAKMKQMAYKPQAVRQVLIPKAGKPGATRPLGISNFEDKLVQKMVQRVLESIYDPLFLEDSYGFRPGRGCHDAIRGLRKHMYQRPVRTVIDVDISNFFGSIDHKALEKILSVKIKDKKFMRYIIRMFKAGVLANGELTVSDEGVMQGSCCSPILANIFAHYVIDLWFEEEVKGHYKGEVKLIRYCDDMVVCCEYEHEAIVIKAKLAERLAAFKLKMNEDKTQLVNFGTDSKGAFNFLGFTFYRGIAKKGFGIVKVKTEGKRMRSKLKKLSQWLRKVKDKLTLKEIWQRLRIALEGYIRYYGVTFNVQSVVVFIHEVRKMTFKWLNRRSQKKSFNWEQFLKYIEANPLPRARVCHKLY